MRTFCPFFRASTAAASEGSSATGRLCGSKGASAAFASWPNGGSYDGNGSAHHEMTLMLGSLLADSLVAPGTERTIDGLREAIVMREDICKRSRRLLGISHPHTERRQHALDSARRALALLGLSEG